MELAAVAVSAADLPRAVAFYELLGFSFPPLQPGEQHVESTGSPKLMIDDHEMMTGLLGEPPRPGNHAAIALLCGSPAEVDEAVAAIGSLGTVVTAAWDAPWGQRYATVADPDGYRVDLYAPLPG
ncbi:glyoxalase [Modestobacter sp. I12A-02628]|uniref:Glyoxalase n=1 Tax=Goekera deserti TaxID=2497753 RepID=A0A7K3WCD9_9ACTN|nr:VOC family protein [Goekera deserti]MPQ98559.1 glyoxalase [Goekera deserti]NDI49071.1 glyoxalase [Goekera deserti]NEL54138.1 glyoxalase [Goekera deserti]